MTGFFLFIVLPLVFSLIISLFDWQLYGSPTFVGVSNYVNLLNGSDPAFFRVLLNTAIFAIFYTTLNLIVSTLVAVWLQSVGGRLAGFFRVIFFIPVVTPMVANALVWRLMLDEHGVVNSFLGVLGISGPAWLASEIQHRGSRCGAEQYQPLAAGGRSRGRYGACPTLHESDLPATVAGTVFLYCHDAHRCVQDFRSAIHAD